MLNRRRFLKALSALGLGAGFAAHAQTFNPKPRFAAFPFTLGVASGYPTASALALWTRLAPVPDAPGGGMPGEVVPVLWEVARDEGMKDVVVSGTAYATPEWAHAVHVEAAGLQPNRPFWYRFSAGDARSPIGRTHTLPTPQNRPSRLRFAFASCQQYEQGYYGAYRHMAADQPDLVLHLGDYIYESSWGRDHVRKHNTPEAVTLDDYRARYALYKSDPDLQAAHAACPWLLTWDDHEVENDYAAERSENLDTPEWFLARRAAAYKAWYEHMPVPRRMVPVGPHARIYTRLNYASLAAFFVLDDRQYRTPQACARPGRGGSNTVDVADCADLADPKRSLLGAQQEQWLETGLGSSRQRWNVIAQQTLFAQLNRKEAGRTAWTDGWDGYPAARRRLLDVFASGKAANPVVIGGDVHAFYVNQLRADFDDPASPVVASEFVGTSISSQHGSQDWLDKLRPLNPHMLISDGRYRGYTRVEVSPKRMQVDLRAMESVATRDAPCRTLASYVVEDGRPGPQRAT